MSNAACDEAQIAQGQGNEQASQQREPCDPGKHGRHRDEQQQRQEQRETQQRRREHADDARQWRLQDRKDCLVPMILLMLRQANHTY